MCEIGSLESCPVFNYDWVIKDFMLKSAEASKGFFSPTFIVQDTTFLLTCRPRKTGSFKLNLVNCDKLPLTVAWFCLHLVGSDGSLKKVCSLKDVAFERNNFYLFQRRSIVYDGIISESDLESKFLAELRIRCYLEIKANDGGNDAKPGVDTADQDPPLIKDLRNEVGTYQFSDFTLVTIFINGITSLQY